MGFLASFFAAAIAVVDAPCHTIAPRAANVLRSGGKAIVSAPAGRTYEEAMLLLSMAKGRPGSLAVQGLLETHPADLEAVAKVRAAGAVRRVVVECRADVPALGTERPRAVEGAPGDWRKWIGPMPLRPYCRAYREGEAHWAYLDFGTGPLGRDGVRFMRAVFLALEPGAPLKAKRIAVSGDAPDRETYPREASVLFTFGSGLEILWRHSPVLEDRVTWETANGTFATKPPPRAQLSAPPAGTRLALPPETEPLLETVFLGCCAMMRPAPVTIADCEKRYVRDGEEWFFGGTEGGME